MSILEDGSGTARERRGVSRAPTRVSPNGAIQYSHPHVTLYCKGALAPHKRCSIAATFCRVSSTTECLPQRHRSPRAGVTDAARRSLKARDPHRAAYYVSDRVDAQLAHRQGVARLGGSVFALTPRRNSLLAGLRAARSMYLSYLIATGNFIDSKLMR